MADIAIFRINYKSDFILTLQSDAGWLTPFCIKFWTGAPSQAYFAGYDGTTYTHCAPVEGDPTKLSVQFDDHHLPIGDLKFQIGYHFTVADFPTSVEDEVINQAAVIIDSDGEQQQVMLDFNGETAPEIAFSLPAYANEAQRIANEQARIAAEEQRVSNEQQRISNEEGRISAEENRQEHEQQRIHNEETRIEEFADLKADAIAATGAANDAATLANEKAQLAADKAALAQASATLANDKAQLAADKAALAQAAATLANDKAALAQQKADYAQAQGDYAKAQGDIALADHERAEADHTRAESDHATAGSDHTQAGTDHTRAESDHATAAADHTQAGQDHTRAESDHTRAESDHAAVEVYVDSLGAFDISAYHATGGVLAKYADLTAALGTNGTNIPEAIRKGGISVKFVQSSDNRYVQYMLVYPTWTTAVFYWQKINLGEEINDLNNDIAEIFGGEVSIPVEATIHGYISNFGGLLSDEKFRRTDYIEVKEGDKIYYRGYNDYPCLCGYSAKPTTGAVVLLAGTNSYAETIVTIPSGVNYVIGCGRVIDQGGGTQTAPIIIYKTEVTGALTELQENLDDVSQNVGSLSELTTEDKSSIVDSINEINENFLPTYVTRDALNMVMNGESYAGELWNIRSGYYAKASGSSYNRTYPIPVKVGDIVRCSTTISCSVPASSTTAGHVMFTEAGATKSSPQGFAVLPFDASKGEVTITQEMYDAGCRYVAFSFRTTDTKTLTISSPTKKNVVYPKNIVKKVSATHVAVYSQIHDKYYIEFNVKKEGTNTLYWRLQDSYLCYSDGQNFYRIVRVLSPSENEYVINVASGATDPHIGGYHGDESTEIVKFFCDGIAYSIDDLPSSLICDSVFYDEKSYMYGNDLGDPDAIITHYKRTYFDGGYTTDNRIIALKQIPVSQFYAGLVCMDRNVGLNWADDNLTIHTTDDNGGGGGEFNIADTGSAVVRYWNATNGVSAVVNTEILDGDVEIPTVSIWSRSGSDHDAKYYRRGGGKNIQEGFVLSTRCSVKYNAKSENPT